ncbi:MAG: DUF2116 family Zn-ribbon domain-containing protein [Thermoplasmatota archaeon]
MDPANEALLMANSEVIVNHAHCWICGRAIPYGDKTCSLECETKYKDNQRKRKSMMWLMYGAMALAVVVLVYNVIRGA